MGKDKNVNYVTLAVTMLAAVNTALIAFGAYHFSNDQLEAVDTVISVAGTVIGVFMSHRK